MYLYPAVGEAPTRTTQNTVEYTLWILSAQIVQTRLLPRS